MKVTLHVKKKIETLAYTSENMVAQHFGGP